MAGIHEQTPSVVVNGTPATATVDTRSTLVDALRDQLGLTGTKRGYDRGECGACTVLLDGRRVLSCTMLALAADGREVTTIEGLAGADGALHPVQQMFLKKDAFQCGSCTPGQVMSAVGCIREGHTSSADEIEEWMSGNICRCAAYVQIVDAVSGAAAAMGAASR